MRKQKKKFKVMSKNQIQYRVYALETGIEVKGDGTQKKLSEWKRREYELQIKAWKAQKGLPVYLSVELKAVHDPEKPEAEPFYVRVKENGPAIRNRLRAIEPEAPKYFTVKGYQEYLVALAMAAEKQLEPIDPATKQPREVDPKMATAMNYARSMAYAELAMARH